MDASFCVVEASRGCMQPNTHAAAAIQKESAAARMGSSVRLRNISVLARIIQPGGVGLVIGWGMGKSKGKVARGKGAAALHGKSTGEGARGWNQGNAAVIQRFKKRGGHARDASFLFVGLSRLRDPDGGGRGVHPWYRFSVVRQFAEKENLT